MSDRELKILIVEDSKAFATQYKQILESQGHKIFVTHDGRTELEIYEKEMKKCPLGKTPFDLIISDNSMVEMNGVAAGKAIQEYVPNQKFFFVTGEKDLVLKEFDVDGKSIDVEQKPISETLFLEKITLLTKN